jgi:hypothetical protein
MLRFAPVPLCLTLFRTFVLLTVAGAAACSNGPSAPQRAEQAPRPSLHGIHSDELQVAMRELDAQASNRIFAQLYTGNRPMVELREVATAADAIADSAAHIPDALTHIELTEEERQAFLGLADTLRVEAAQLSSDARHNDLARARAALQRMTATCNACHTAFRISPAAS